MLYIFEKMDYQKLHLFSSGENSKVSSNRPLKQRILDKKFTEHGTKIFDLPSDCFEKIASYLDARANLNMLFSNKKIYSKLFDCAFFWKHLYELEGLDKVSSLRDEEINQEDRVAWSGELLHSNKTSEEATRWQKIYQRGIQMRKNLAEGKCEMWRLFMVYEDEDNIPVRKMTQDTQQEDLEILNKLMPYYDLERSKNVHVNRYWNEEFLVVIHWLYDRFGSFHDIFVWQWQKCPKPVFLYYRDLLPTYPRKLMSESCYIHKNFLVFIPDTDYINQSNKSTSMVRVHDLSDRFKLVGKFDFDEDNGQASISSGTRLWLSATIT